MLRHLWRWFLHVLNSWIKFWHASGLHWTSVLCSFLLEGHVVIWQSVLNLLVVCTAKLILFLYQVLQSESIHPVLKSVGRPLGFLVVNQQACILAFIKHYRKRSLWFRWLSINRFFGRCNRGAWWLFVYGWCLPTFSWDASSPQIF
jgi:hypothetical protein